jgi:glucokinase
MQEVFHAEQRLQNLNRLKQGSMNNKIIIGVDLGGTKIMTGAIDFKGTVLQSPIKTPTIGSDTSDAILNRIITAIEKTMSSLNMTTGDIAGIGIGSTGPLDIDAGLILECPQLPNMHFFPLRKTIQDYFGIPVIINNDANCLIYGETVFGAAADKRNVVGFTLGTGIGCAVIIDKKLLNGSTGTAAEIWISPYRSGIIEDFVSGSGVSKIYKSISGRDKTSLEVYNLAMQGEKLALQTWSKFGQHLAVPIAWAVNLIDPEMVLLGGSISAAYPFFKSSLEEHLRKWICPVPAERTKVIPAKLGDNAGFIGAACLVIEDH